MASNQAKTLIVNRYGLEMRGCFDFNKYSLNKWFPGHMFKGTLGVQSKFSRVDCVVELHDARIPFSGRNNAIIKQVAQMKPHILVMNKIDLITSAEMQATEKHFRDNKINNVLFANCKDQGNQALEQLVPLAAKLSEESERYNRSEASDYAVMIMGVPNVGKSSFINALRSKYLRKKKGTKVGPHPGVTKQVMEKIKVCEDPATYVYDTPGILSPRIESLEVGLKLAVCNTIKNAMIGEEIIADYLLFRLNIVGNHSYVDALGIEEPTDSISKLLRDFAYKENLIQRRKDFDGNTGYIETPDLIASANKFLKIFNKGTLGSIDLDNLRDLDFKENAIKLKEKKFIKRFE